MFGKVGNFFSETWQELKKVSWPDWIEVWQATLVVVVATFIVAFFIFVIDFGLSTVSRVLFG